MNFLRKHFWLACMASVCILCVVVGIENYNKAAEPPIANMNGTGKDYVWTVTRVIDGDTFETNAMFYPPELGRIHVRIFGVDTPESGARAKCDSERQLAAKAKAFSKKSLEGKQVLVTDLKQDKYGGRLVGTVMLDGKQYAMSLIQNGYAVPYDGGTKQSWCK